ncbi:MAG TPA: HEAT repeat domain-containing protein [Chlamydiales bacterium]|nr:HEAT repeat domain-containing protein [Chlamydiales bacterium]
MENESIPLLDAIDMEILMHREAHFGGNFGVMIDYYDQEGVGVMPDFEQKRIRELAHIEKELRQNLADVILPELAHLRVEMSKQLYQDLREVYEQEPPNPHAVLISNLILSEEEDPQEEMEALIHCGQEIVPLLIDLISSESFYDPLYPGYGRSPIFAAKILGQIKDETAIPALFQALGQDNFFTDEAIIQAIRAIGDKSKVFLIKALKHQPYSKNNEHAAICLMEFSEDPEIAQTCLELLKDPAVIKRESLATYLVFGCAGLEQDFDRQEFKKIMDGLNEKSELYLEMKSVCSNWNKSN